MPQRGPFIVVEGLDRSGKSTQTALLLARLEAAGIPAKLLKFPGRWRPIPPLFCCDLDPGNNIDRTTSIGQMINGYLQSTTDLDDHAIHLLFSANRWELAYVRSSNTLQGTLIQVNVMPGQQLNSSSMQESPSFAIDTHSPGSLSLLRRDYRTNGVGHRK